MFARIMTALGNMVMGGAGVFSILFVVGLTNVVWSYISPSGNTMTETVGGYTGLNTDGVL